MAVFTSPECMECKKQCKQFNVFEKEKCFYWINRKLIPKDKQRFDIDE